MQSTSCFRSFASARVLTIAIVLLAVGACSEDPEEKLRDAGKQLDAAQKDAQKAQQRLGTDQQKLEQAHKQVSDDRQAVTDEQASVGDANENMRRYATDDIVFREVQRRLLDDSKLVDTAVSVQVSDGVVTLTGDVPNAELRTRAGKLAETSTGVVKVVNNIQVADPTPVQLGVPTSDGDKGAPSADSAAQPKAAAKPEAAAQPEAAATSQ